MGQADKDRQYNGGWKNCERFTFQAISFRERGFLTKANKILNL